MKKRLKNLPDCDDLFDRYFKPWHKEQSLDNRGYKGTRPDAEHWCNSGISAADASPLTEEGQRQIKCQIDKMFDAAKADWPTYLSVLGNPDLDWIDAFDEHYCRTEVAALIERSDPTDFANEYLVLCCEFGAVLGNVMQEVEPQLEWLYDWPYWESGLIDTNSGYRINVFHWAIKKLSDYGVEDGYRAKVLACCDLIQKQWES